jgi:uncharacterized PurR-regulated membrane protein YhhQ (DUF165 family)
MNYWNSRYNKLFILLAGFFVTNAIMAEFIGVKIFSLEKLFGWDPANLTMLGVEGLGFNLTAGVILWPVVFVMTDIINEYYGKKGVKFLSYMTAGLILYSFIIVFFAIRLDPADFWPTSHLFNYEGEALEVMRIKVSDYDAAYKVVFGQGMWIIIGSLIAFLVGQLVDVGVFRQIKKITGENKLWLRATGSTLVSQLIDSFIVLFVAFYIGGNWPLSQVLAIGVVNYIYKFIVAVALTPVIYAVHAMIDSYLGHEQSLQVRMDALE